MELYIEKQFLDDFYLTLDINSLSLGQKTIYRILKEYGMVDWYINCPIETPEELEQLQLENPLFGYRAVYSAPIPVDDIGRHFFQYSAVKQTLIFCAEQQDWFIDAEKKGALCFSMETYETRIQDIIRKCHDRFDLFDDFPGWDWFQFYSLIPGNKVVFNDSYILSDKSKQRIKDNIIPFLKKILENKKDTNYCIEVYTSSQTENTAKKYHKLFHSVFANYRAKFMIISNEHSRGSFDFHDRVVHTNFLIVESGVGFNLIPGKKNSNSKIESSSIFDLFSYRRINNLNKLHDKYLAKLKSPGYSTVNFISYPEI